MDNAFEAIRQLMTAFNKIDGSYYFCAKSLGVKENTLAVLYALDDGLPHSQKQLSEEWLIPRTTVNTIVKELEKEGYDQGRTAKKTGLQPFVVRNYSTYGRRYSKEELEAIVKECVDTEEKVKTGQLTDTLSVELLLIKFSS